MTLFNNFLNTSSIQYLENNLIFMQEISVLFSFPILFMGTKPITEIKFKSEKYWFQRTNNLINLSKP